MQTQPKPPPTETAISAEDRVNTSPPTNRKLVRGLNIGLALSGLALYALYISKGAEFYNKLPGGRKWLFAGAVLIFGGLALARLLVSSKFKVQSSKFKVQNFRESLIVNRQSLIVNLLVGLVVGLGLLVRVWGVNFGLPYLEHVDEWNVAERGIHIIQSGSFDPYDYQHPGLAENDRQAFTYPTLYTYLQTGVYTARFLEGVAVGRYDSTNNLNSPLVKAEFYEWGRALTALLGAGTVLLVYMIGRLYYGRRAGLVGSLFLAFFYLHALNSHWITTDVPSGFFALLPFFWIYRIGQGEESRRDYLLAGLLGGLAIGAKYNNALILLPLLLAHFLSRPPRRWVNWNLPMAFGAAFAGFFVSSPFIFFHLPAFFGDVAAIINHYQNEGHPGFEGTNNWSYYLGAMGADNLAVLILGLAGVLLAFARHRRQDIILLSFPLISYIQLSSYKVNFTRNLMPIIPFLTIFGGWALVMLVEFAFQKKNLARWQAPALGVLAVAAVISPALTIIDYDRYNAQPTNRARATEWIEANLPHGAKLWIEPFSVDLLPRNAYRVEGGKSALENPPEWYAANGYNYIVLSEAYYKEAYETGKPSVREAYKALIEGPRPAGIQLVQDFPKNNTDQPGARVLILSTGLPVVAGSLGAYRVKQPLQVDFGGKIKLAGADVPPSAKPGATVPLIFYWQTLAPVQADYTTFIHVLDSSGKTVAQLDLAPLSGTRPTSTWKPGEFVRDEYPLTLPANLPPGEYRLSTGLYIAPNGGRLALASGGDEAEIGKLILTK